MAQPGFESRFICFQSPCFLIYVNLPSRERKREKTPIPEAHRKNLSISTGHAFWTGTSKEPGAGWSWKEVRSEHLSRLSLASLSAGQVRAGSVRTDPGSAYQGWRDAPSWKPWLLSNAQGTFLCQSCLVVLSGMATLPIPLQAWDDLLASICIEELQVVQTQFGRHPSWASSQEPSDHSPDNSSCLQNPRTLSCSRKPASRATRASERLE